MRLVTSLAAGCALSVVVASSALSQIAATGSDHGFQPFLRQFEQGIAAIERRTGCMDMSIF